MQAGRGGDQIVEALFIFIIGAMAGSFLNVCIYRLPLGKSIVRPGSHCMRCGRDIRWFDNIPVMSFIFLRGKCRRCGLKFSVRYPLVELLTAVFFLMLYLKFGLSPEFFIFAVFTSSMVVMSFIDIDHRIIPDEIDLPGILLGVVLSFAHPPLHSRPQPWDSVFSSPGLIGLASSLSGILVGGGILAALAVFGKMAFKKEAMGGGDIKLIAMIGAFMGWQFVLLTVFLSAVTGSIVGFIMKLKTNSSYIPYGPYLALGALISVFFGEEIILWYVNSLL
jgi:leader peptidase (prepilin peptidase) / N-methyltransferase